MASSPLFTRDWLTQRHRQQAKDQPITGNWNPHTQSFDDWLHDEPPPRYNDTRSEKDKRNRFMENRANFEPEFP